MSVNFIDGVHDKTEAGLRAILYAQAKVRLLVALPVIVLDLFLFFLSPTGIPLWFAALTAAYCAYALSPYQFIRNGTHSTLQYLLIATAVLDPAVLSVWISVTHEYGSLIAGFYLFTTLGFGFRTGRQLMHLCQIASIIGFTLALVFNPFWHEHPVIWTALLIPLIVVPMYAGVLINTLREAREHAEQESRGKSDLLAKVSHELRTPLTGIVAAAELLAVESNDHAVAQRTQTILSLSDNLLREINDLLDEAKFDATSVALNRAPVDLPKHMIGLRTTLETMAAGKGLQLHVTTDSGVTDRVEVDAHYLDRILLNLAGNAIKFTDRGSVSLALDLVEKTLDRYRLRFSVTDTGIGIPESFRANMFEPFSQVDQGSSRRREGTGLGLALSKKIIQVMGGELQFESVLGHGSRFWFELSLTRAAVSHAEVLAVDAGEIHAPRRILVAEDNLTNLVLIKELLEIDRHEITTCTSGMAALELLAKQNFDLLVLDYNLGDMDGVRVLQTYHFGKLRPAPALFLTADATALTATRLKAAGAAGILYKPVNLAALRKALAQIDLLKGVDANSVSDEVAYVQAEKPARPARPALSVVPVNPLDQEVLDDLREISNRPDFLPTLLTHAESDIMRSCQQLLDSLNDKNYASVRDSAHALKGVCANVGAVRLVALASNLMSISSDELEASSERLIVDIRDSSRSTIQALRKIIDDETPASAGNAGALHLD